MMPAMIRTFQIFCMLFLLAPLSAQAQVGEEDFSLMEEAVFYSAQADAYGAYCNKESDLAQSFIDQFRDKKGISEEQEEGLTSRKGKVFEEQKGALEVQAQDCKNLDFMMARLEVMKQLKDVSYRLNGIDPETIPSPDIPKLDALIDLEDL